MEKGACWEHFPQRNAFPLTTKRPSGTHSWIISHIHTTHLSPSPSIYLPISSTPISLYPPAHIHLPPSTCPSPAHLSPSPSIYPPISSTPIAISLHLPAHLQHTSLLLPAHLQHTYLMMMNWCLMSSDVSWHIRDKLWPMPKHGAINLYVHGNQKAR